MRTFLKILFLLLISFSAKSQTPAGFPSPYSTAWYRIGWLQADSGNIPAYRDTNWIPRFQGSFIFWQHAGVDTAFWYRLGNKWVKLNATGGTSDSAVNAGLWLSQNIVGTIKTINADSAAMAAYFLRKSDTTFQTLEQVLNTGSTLLSNHAIDANNHDFLLDNTNTFSFVSISGDTIAQISGDAASGQMISIIQDLSNASSIIQRPESIQMISPLISLNTPQVNFATYGLGTHFGTKAYGLAVDAGGNVIEDTTTGGGSSSTYTPYTLVVTTGGQSNNHGQAEDAGAGTDTTSNPRILIYDYTNSTWHTAHVGASPFSTTAPTAGSPTHAFFLAKKWATLHPNDSVRIIPTWADATAIAQWFNGTTKGPQTDTMVNRFTRAGVDHVDLFIWDQGESDPTLPFATYTAAWDSIKANLRRLPFWPSTANIVVVGMPDTLSGAPTGYQGQDPNLKSYDYGLDEYVGYARTDSVSVNGGVGNHLHFNSYGLWKLGTQRIWAAWLSHPSRAFERGNSGIAAGSAANLSRLDIVHTSPAGAGAQVAGVYTTNTSSSGRTGYKAYNNDSTHQLFAGVTGSGATYASATGGIIGTETNSDISIFRNFTLYMQFLSAGITIPQRVTFTSTGQQQITNATTTGAPGIAINGDGSNFGQVSIGNSANTSIPNAMYAYFSNGYKIRIGANGTTISDTTTAPADPVNTLHVNGSFGRRIDSLTTTGNVLLNKRNNVYMFKTGASNDTCFLPSAAGCYGRIYTIIKMDTGTAGNVIISPQTGQYIDRQLVKPVVTGSRPLATIISNGVNGWYTLDQPASGITSLNGLSGATQIFATGTSGTDFGISSTGTTHTFNIPDASGSARGVVTTGTQTLAGVKTFSSSPIVPTPSSGTDATNKNYVDGLAGATYVATADAPTITNTTTPGTLLGSGTGVSWTGGFFTVGKTLIFKGGGIISTDATNPIVDFSLTTASTSLNLGSFNIPSLSNIAFQYDLSCVVRSTGSSGVLAVYGTITVNGVTQFYSRQNVTLNTTISQTFDIQATWTTADTDNSITGQMATIKVL